jgi:carbonic anhydrase
MSLEQYVYSLEPGYSEPDLRKAFSHAVPLRTTVIYCYDTGRAGQDSAGRGLSW